MLKSIAFLLTKKEPTEKSTLFDLFLGVEIVHLAQQFVGNQFTEFAKVEEYLAEECAVVFFEFVFGHAVERTFGFQEEQVAER